MSLRARLKKLEAERGGAARWPPTWGRLLALCGLRPDPVHPVTAETASPAGPVALLFWRGPTPAERLRAAGYDVTDRDLSDAYEEAQRQAGREENDAADLFAPRGTPAHAPPR